MGKSTLVQRLLTALALPSAGFYTKKEQNRVYLYAAAEQPPIRTEGSCAAIMRPDGWEVCSSVFDTLGASLLRQPPAGHIVVMDELGRLESTAQAFCAAVLQTLDGDAPVLGVVKPLANTPFLRAIHTHPKVRLFPVTEDNRNALFSQILGLLKTGGL